MLAVAAGTSAFAAVAIVIAMTGLMREEAPPKSATVITAWEDDPAVVVPTDPVPVTAGIAREAR